MTTQWPLREEVDLHLEPTLSRQSPSFECCPQNMESASGANLVKLDSLQAFQQEAPFSSKITGHILEITSLPTVIPRTTSKSLHIDTFSDATMAADDVFSIQAVEPGTPWDDELDYEEEEEEEDGQETIHSRSDSTSTIGSTNSATVAWAELERVEEAEARGEKSDEATSFLLARLEQENQALASNPKSGLRRARSRKQSRPPSFHMLKRLVEEQSNAATQHPLPLDPSPMTELEFWTALVQNYLHTVQRLPTLTSSKIKAGVPPPLRGVVWVSMAGARDVDLAADFERLSQEPSPYEGLIGKDVGRSFPGVDMFRDPNGEGQRMLGTVLKCFSLYDEEIGYCQGLGFLVGPLLMHMGDKDAFCVLVRLMENYDLRSCFLPSLEGLHVRVFQFQRLLDLHLPTLAAHLATLQVEAAYLAQWFLSFFAVTCPLPMLFRIYDVIFAEGASETIMRVALSLMRRNEFKLMACTEFEEVMHILLSRALWDTYASNADDLVNDFMGMTGVVTRENLQSLVVAFKEAQSSDHTAWFSFLPDASASASKFLGRLWTATTPAKPSGLAPSTASSFRPGSFLRRSPSKQSIASTFLSTDGIDNAAMALADGTPHARDSPPTSIMLAVPQSASKEDKDLHSQIEDLLTALSEQQRENALLAAELQSEREDRAEDHRAFQQLIASCRQESQLSRHERRQTMSHPIKPSTVLNPQRELDNAISKAASRLHHRRTHKRNSSVFETKQRLRESLTHSREQLEIEMSRSATLSKQLDEQELETSSIREQLREAQSRLQNGLREREKLEKTVTTMQRARSRSSVTWSEPETPPIPTICRSDTADSRMSLASISSSSGLREFKLGRPDSGTPVSGSSPTSSIPRRGISLATQAILATEDHAPAEEDALLVELVNAKTSEAMARQELEEVKGKLDAMRKMLGVPTLSNPPSGSSPLKPTTGNASNGGGFWGWGKRSPSVASVAAQSAT